MGSVVQEYLKEFDSTANLEIFAQEISDDSYAICMADIIIKGEKFDYLISNPSY